MHWSRQALLASFIDLALIAIAWWLAFWLRFNLDTPDDFQAMMVQTLPAPLLAYAISLTGWRVYRHIWRYTSVAELMRLVYGVAVGGLLAAAVVLMLRVPYFPRSVLLLHPMLALLLLGAARMGARLLLTRREHAAPTGKPLLLVGSVHDAAAALPALRSSRLWSPVGIVSPIANEKGSNLQGLSVLGGLAEIRHIAERTKAAAALVVLAAGSDARREAL